MSRIYFTTPTDEAEVRGWERAWMGLVTAKAGATLIREAISVETLRDRFINPNHSLMNRRSPNQLDAEWARWFDLSLATHYDLETLMVGVDGEPLNAWEVSLNTLMAAGSDVMRLMARIDAQCESHGYIEGPARAWFAGLIEDGRRSNMLRADSGWESVVELARADDRTPMVMSYSVTDGFPNPRTSTFELPEGDEDCESWGALPLERRWELGMEWLRAHPGKLELSPVGWGSYRFGHGVSAFDLAATVWEERRVQAAR